jgi:hypothetical protein
MMKEGGVGPVLDKRGSAALIPVPGHRQSNSGKGGMILPVSGTFLGGKVGFAILGCP